MRRLCVAVLLALNASGCVWGSSGPSHALVREPGGARVTARLTGSGKSLSAELLAADSAGMYLFDGRVTYATWRAVGGFSIPGLGAGYNRYSSTPVTPALVARLQRVSRFPQGMSAELLARVLAQLGQDTLDSLAPPAGSATTGDRLTDSNEAHAAHDAPSGHDGLDAFADETARHIARFADPREAISQRYRRVGADFPGMGEHWLNSGILLRGDLDPARPTLLSYAELDGRRTLVGAGFMIVTRGDEVPSHAPGWPDAWHEHSGSLADESGANPMQRSNAASGTRVWVLHIWTPLANPASRYAPDNWALPFARFGLAAPDNVDANSGRALSLALGGDGYLRTVLNDAGLRQPVNAEATDQVLARARVEATRIATSARAAGMVTAADVQALRTLWSAVERGLLATVGEGVRPILQPPHAKGRAER